VGGATSDVNICVVEVLGCCTRLELTVRRFVLATIDNCNATITSFAKPLALLDRVIVMKYAFAVDARDVVVSDFGVWLLTILTCEKAQAHGVSVSR